MQTAQLLQSAEYHSEECGIVVLQLGQLETSTSGLCPACEQTSEEFLARFRTSKG